MNARRWFFLFLGVLTLLRLAMTGQLELSPDEAYYFQWSQRMDWSYFSKGPGVAAAMWLGTHLFGANEFGVRLLSPLLSLGTSLLLFSFARRLYGESVGIWTVVTINCIPIFNVGSVVLTIDPLSIFFWMAALYACWLALERSPQFSPWWPATGALIGCGFLAKYTNAMQLLSIVLLLAFTPKWRRELARPGFYSMLAVFALFTAPPLIWNAQHDWITLHHLGARGGLDTPASFSPAQFLEFLGAHFGVYSPLIFGGLLAGLWWGWGRASIQMKPRFLLAFTLPLFALYFALSFKQAGEANWTAPATLSLVVLAVHYWHERAKGDADLPPAWTEGEAAAPPSPRWTRRFVFAALAVGLAMSLLVVDTELPRRLGIPFSYDLDPSTRLRGWRSAAAQVESARREFDGVTGNQIFLIANKYGTAASLAFYLEDPRTEGPGHPPIYVPESPFPENQFYFWPRYDENLARPAGMVAPEEYYTEESGYNPFLGRDALYVTDRAEERPPSTIKRGFERVEMIRCIDFQRRGQPLRQLRIFACYRYRQVSL